uniref:FAD/NAD(P)-binding domain-containing protein n=1 Tax=Tetraselmis chuii TaxID=63592 RepID=A0A7S1X7Z9_9CHLO|mmetsp:Transcript_37454/g.67076  ORF Transcript_37454/g.67076 Transcript_37454/m.67076 type:complete len:425 (+) Transcript_37454:138-1412(+)
MATRRVAVIGAGPVGLHAALRLLEEEGTEVLLLERGAEVAANVKEWGHVRLFSSWKYNCRESVLTKLQSVGLVEQNPFDPEAFPTGGEYREKYLTKIYQYLRESPRAQVILGCNVESVTRDGFHKQDDLNGGARKSRPFHLLLSGDDHREWFESADLVLDCSGTWGNNLYMGPGGAPAVGERNQSKVTYKIPDLDDTEREEYAGRHTLVIGAGYSAITTLRGLINLKAAHPDTQITWLTRKGTAPFAVLDDDPLPERKKLALIGNSIVAGGSLDAGVTHLSGYSIESVHEDGSTKKLFVQLRPQGEELGEEALRLTVDRVVANVGWRPDASLYSELHVHQCWASDGPIKLASSLIAASGKGGGDCLKQAVPGPELLLTPEPGFLLLGMKSYGRNSLFILKIGFEQIEQAVGLLFPSDPAAVVSS